MFTRSHGWFLVLIAGAWASSAPAVLLVQDGRPASEIVLAADAGPAAQTAARELQRHLQTISGALLPIVSQPSSNFAHRIFVGASEFAGRLGAAAEDLRDDGFKLIIAENYAVLLGRDIYHCRDHFARFQDVPRQERQAAWEEFAGRKWRFPPIIDYREFNDECGFHLQDASGTLYAAYELLEMLGWRWYLPREDLGIVAPRLATIRLSPCVIKREPEFGQRIFTDLAAGRFTPEFLWFKSLRVGAAAVMPIYHSLSGLTKIDPAGQPREYFGKTGGVINYHVPKLTNPRLRADFVEYLGMVDRAFPGIAWACIGQPDGWFAIDDEDVAAGWDKIGERGRSGRFSDYAWDFIGDIRGRLMAREPARRFTVFAYGCTRRPPVEPREIPENMTVVFCQTSANWMLANDESSNRGEWLARLKNKSQFMVWEYYLQHAHRYNFPPVPIIFTRLMRGNFQGLYDRSAGFLVELPWSSPGELEANRLSLRRPGLTHFMLYLHSRLCWDRNLEPQALLAEYCDLFFGPAAGEMRSFYEFAESVWMRPQRRQITAAGGFLKPADVARYFEILETARARAGATIYGRRIDLIAGEMAGLKTLFESLRRRGPQIIAPLAKHPPLIDGDLAKHFWRDGQDDFMRMREMRGGAAPTSAVTRVAFRWLPDDSALAVGVECHEPRMDNLKNACRDRDSTAIFNDDNVEIRLETNGGIAPFIVLNPAGTIYDECITDRLEDLPHFYGINQAAVKKYDDRWTAEVLIPAAAINGSRPAPGKPWGVHVNRQRMAGGKPEHYMLSPSGSNFKDILSMANLVVMAAAPEAPPAVRGGSQPPGLNPD